ncbi:LacI family DNA-binding transcriptional regulator [Streptomyces sp. NPDC005931]|uniref:LacI family DNA-binding transcriptional regulator n=1 Tax=Streptomyces sp. NPDC005931 TaxID=3364737 RepID=UPI00369EB974
MGITDVARRAGVSPSTVSYALSGKRPISDETRRRVRAAALERGYRPPPPGGPPGAARGPGCWPGRLRCGPAWT